MPAETSSPDSMLARNLLDFGRLRAIGAVKQIKVLEVRVMKGFCLILVMVSANFLSFKLNCPSNISEKASRASRVGQAAVPA